MSTHSQKLKLASPWEEVKERLKENDGRLTDDDLFYTPGHEDELLHRLAGIMNRPKEEIRVYIESVSANNGKAG